MGEEVTKAPMGGNSGRLRVTLDVEVNEQLLNAAKDSMANIGHAIPDMVRRGREGMQKSQE
jgi:hypothetical protein